MACLGSMRSATPTWVVLVLLLVLHGCVGDSTTVRFTIVGDGGQVNVIDPRTGTEQSCSESCELTFQSGFLRLNIGAFYDPTATSIEIGGPDLFVDEDGRNQFGPLEGDDLQISVRFTGWEEAPIQFARSGAFAPEGDLIIGTFHGVGRATRDGEVAWATTPIPDVDAGRGQITSVATTSTGESYVTHGYPRMLTRLSATGDVVSSMPLSDSFKSFAVTPGQDLVIVDDQVHFISRTGGELWSSPLSNGNADDVTVGSDGTIYVATRTSFPLAGTIYRFTSLGAPITPTWDVPADEGTHIALAVDQTGALLVASYVVQRLDPTTGAVLYSTPLADPESEPNRAERYPGVAVTSTNQAFVWMPRVEGGGHGTRVAAGTDIRTYDTSGTVTWFQGFPSVLSPGSTSVSPNGGVVLSGSCDHDRHCAVFGNVPATIYDVP